MENGPKQDKRTRRGEGDSQQGAKDRQMNTQTRASNPKDTAEGEEGERQYVMNRG